MTRCLWLLSAMVTGLEELLGLMGSEAGGEK